MQFAIRQHKPHTGTQRRGRCALIPLLLENMFFFWDSSKKCNSRVRPKYIVVNRFGNWYYNANKLYMRYFLACIRYVIRSFYVLLVCVCFYVGILRVLFFLINFLCVFFSFLLCRPQNKYGFNR